MAGHVAVRERGEVHTEVWWGNLKERNNFEYPSVDGRIIFRRIFRKWDERVWSDRCTSG